MARRDRQEFAGTSPERAAKRRMGANAVAPAPRIPDVATGASRATDTVIVKLKHTPTATRRIESALRTTAPNERRTTRAAPAPSLPFLATLIENGYAERIVPVFPGPLFEPAARGALRSMASAIREDQPLSAGRGLVSIRVDRRTSAEQLVAHLNTLKDEIEYAYVPAIKYPSPRRTRRAGDPNDALGTRQWGHGAIRIREARRRAGFREADAIVVAVLDSGIDREHPDLRDAIGAYLNFLPNEDERDYIGHGTHVAGIIGAVMNNRIGIAGVCAARIMALKALPKRGNRWNAEAYYQALAHPLTGGAKVLNLSLGGDFDRGEQDIVADLVDGGVTVVAAMGNDFEEGNPVSYPAAYDGVIAVGACDEADRRARFSCTGSHIALVAPGVNILSTTPRYPSQEAERVLYDAWPGTSMAAPHVAAAAALLLAKSPRLTPKQIRDRLTKSADRVRWQRARPDDEYGFGRLNVEAALKRRR